MASNVELYDAAAQAAVNAVTVLLNSGYVEIYTGSQPAVDGTLTGTKLAKLPLSSTAFGSATSSSGTTTATANSITTENALATGTAGYFALLKSDDATVVLTGTCGTGSGYDMILNTTSVTNGLPVSITSLTISLPQ